MPAISSACCVLSLKIETHSSTFFKQVPDAPKVEFGHRQPKGTTSTTHMLPAMNNMFASQEALQCVPIAALKHLWTHPRAADKRRNSKGLQNSLFRTVVCVWPSVSFPLDFEINAYLNAKTRGAFAMRGNVQSENCFRAAKVLQEHNCGHLV